LNKEFNFAILSQNLINIQKNILKIIEVEMMSKIEEKMKSLGINLPAVSPPIGSFVPCVQTGNLVYTSGQVCMRNGVLAYKGKVGKEVTIEEGSEAARIAIINALAILKEHLGSLDRVKRIVKLLGLVACVPEFDKQPSVINGASDLLLAIFKEKGQHARSAIGVSALPNNSPVEIEMIVEVE